MPSVTVPRKRAREGKESVVATVAAAVERLLDGGERFTNLGVQRIAGESGIARSTFYRHFPDKSTLLIEVARLATSEQLSLAVGWMEMEDPGREDVEAAFVELVARHREHATLVRALNEVAGYDEQVGAFWRSRIGESAEALARFITEGQEAGRIDPALDPATTAELLGWGIERVATQHVLGEPAAADAQFARRVAATIWSVLGLDGDRSA